MNQYRLLNASICLFLSLLSLMGQTALSESPHVLFIAVDDLRPELGCYGKNQVVSPHIDRLASKGVLFTRAYCQVPVCGASRASLLTGLRPTPERFLSYNSKASTDAPGIPDLPGWLKQHGYDTFSLGKIYHHKNDNLDSWTQLGDDRIRWPGFKDYQLAESHPPKGWEGGNRGVSFECADVPENMYYQYQLADVAIARLRAIKQSGKPSFLAVGFTKPHLPFVAPKKYWDMYKREELRRAPNPFRPRNAPAQAMHNFGELRSYTDIPQGKAPIPDELALTLKHGYYACVTYTDAMVGRLLTELDNLDMRKNTVIVLWGDHGWQLGEHALWCKHANFDTSLNAPLIISAPGKSKGRQQAGLVEFVDIYPTLCDLVNVPQPKHVQGTSMVPLLQNSKRPWKKAVFARYHAGDSVRTDRYLYTQWRRDGTVVAHMLYDHKVDPMENINIADIPTSTPIVKRMQKLLSDGWKPIAAALNE